MLSYHSKLSDEKKENNGRDLNVSGSCSERSSGRVFLIWGLLRVGDEVYFDAAFGVV